MAAQSGEHKASVSNVFRNLSRAGVIAGLVVGAAAALLIVNLVFLVLSLLNPINLLPGAALVLIIGAIMGLLIAHLESAAGKVKYRTVLVGLLGWALWLLARSVTGMVSIQFVVGGVFAFLVTAFFIRSIFAGITPERMRKDHVESLVVRYIRGLFLSAMTLMVAFPFAFMLSMSFRTRAEYLSDPANLSINLARPLGEVFSAFAEVLVRFNFFRYIINSTGVALLTVLITLTTGILGAYAVTRLRFPGQRFLSKAILLIYMFPAIVLVIPLYSVFTQLGLRDTLHGLLIVYSAMTIPVALYMLRSYFQTLPADLEEAGLIDGCSRGQVIIRITLPLSGPAIASVGLYVFMIAWNEFLFAFMFLDSPSMFTLSRGMVVLDDMEVPRQLLMAGATIITIPIMFLFFRFQKYLVGGLTAGSVKG